MCIVSKEDEWWTNMGGERIAIGNFSNKSP